MCVLSGGSVAENRNRGCAAMLANPGYAWVFQIDDDQLFAPDVLLRLLNRERNVICGTTPSRATGAPVIYRFDAAQGARYYGWEELPTSGIVEGGAGGACVLIRRAVLEAMEPPWFALGQFTPDRLDEDFYFYEKARKAGFPPCVDLEAVLGHITAAALWPVTSPTGWSVMVDLVAAPPIAPEGVSPPHTALTP